MSSLDLWPIGNCQVSTLIDSDGRMVWGCVPRVDGDPLFSALLGGGDADIGYWSIALEGATMIAQDYVRNTPVLVTRHADDAGNAIEVVDFCPRFRRHGRNYRPVSFVRIVRPVAGSPRITVKLRPTCGWGNECGEQIGASNHVRFLLDVMTMRLTTNAPIGMVEEERAFRVEQPLYFFLGPDESFQGELSATIEQMLADTIGEWQEWVSGLAVPLEWQGIVIRAAITLKLCQHEETGAIVAALTTSIPEHADSASATGIIATAGSATPITRCNALNRLGALDVLEGYLGYLRNIVAGAAGGHIQPLYGVLGEPTLEERVETGLEGYRGMGPVRVGNQAYEQIQHDAYGQIVLSSVQAFFDERLLPHERDRGFQGAGICGRTVRGNITIRPTPGLWELRTRQPASTPIPPRCAGRRATGWAMPRTSWTCPSARRSGDRACRGDPREYRGIGMAAGHQPACPRPFAGDDLDASLIQLLDLRFFTPDDPRFRGTLAGGGKGPAAWLVHAALCDRGRFRSLPETAFNVCTFWLIEALQATGRGDDARALFETMLARRTGAGLLSEDIDPTNNELWGNYPQTYSLVGMINCAAILSKPWSSIR